MIAAVAQLPVRNQMTLGGAPRSFEVFVLGDDHEVRIDRVLPDRLVCRPAPERSLHVLRAWIRIRQRLHEPSREVLVEE
jgi:hypothetical protein